MENDGITGSRIASWYHAQILRIPHGKHTPTKRYLTDDQVVELFDGKVVIQEKVDGKMAWDVKYGRCGKSIKIYEDMTGKHTPHDHVMQYNDLPPDKRIYLETIMILNNDPPLIEGWHNDLDYAKVRLSPPTIGAIHALLEMFSKSQSILGSDAIVGLVVKIFRNQLLGKWINIVFVDAFQ